MVARIVAPERGDVVWLDFGATRGSEQRGRRPAIVLSPASYNKLSGLALVCPVTSTDKPYPFRVPVSVGTVRGFAIADQVRSISWVERGAKRVGRTPVDITESVIARVRALLE
ncbi:MAG TPA: type II toxin-antitoxin system PemK/MazF family toxin [Candidatus Paceibacterota bacterium]